MNIFFYDKLCKIMESIVKASVNFRQGFFYYFPERIFVDPYHSTINTKIPLQQTSEWDIVLWIIFLSL